MVIRAPFKYNKTKEQYILKKYKNFKKNSQYTPKIYEIFFINYLLISNNKFFFLLKLEKVLNV